MSDEENRATIEALAAAITKQDRAALDALFTEDVVFEWPQSGERIVGGENRRAIYGKFPSLPKVTPRQIRGRQDLWVLEADLVYADGSTYQCVFVFEMRAGRIAKETAYWAQPFPAPEWRAPFIEKM